MRTKRLAPWAFFAILLWPMGFAASPGTAAAEKAEAKVTLQDITYDDLGKVIRSHKGKVIVVDFWGEY